MGLQDAVEPRLGWTDGPDNRGTLNILWTCLVTSFLCCWSVLVVNVPGPRSSTWQQLLRKIYLLGVCVLAPEIIFQAALGQWLSARHARDLFHASGYTDWTLRHSFYANMGAVHLQSPDFKPFPVDAKQLHYLITRGYVKYPKIDEDQIRDKNKLDGMLRFITLLQTIWFVLNVVGRATQHLPITALELSTSALVLMTIATTVCWMRKPADVQRPEYIVTDATVAEILRDAGPQAARVYHHTPLDFASRKEWAWSILWAHGLSYLHRLSWGSLPNEKPISRFQNTIVPVIEGWYYLLFVAVSTAYFGIFIAGWNFSFPTEVEKHLWRIASIVALSSALGFCAAMKAWMSWYPSLRRRLSSAMPTSIPDGETDRKASRSSVLSSRVCLRPRSLLKTFFSFLGNPSIMKDPELDAPVGAVIATWVFGSLYCFARGYVTVADIIELRSLPPSAYIEVDWSKTFPHFR